MKMYRNHTVNQGKARQQLSEITDEDNKNHSIQNMSSSLTSHLYNVPS